MPGLGVYNMFAAVRIRGRLDAQALELSVNKIVERHETLRTCFRERDGVPYQVILDDVHVTLEMVELPGSSHAGREKALREIAVAHQKRPYDLSETQRKMREAGLPRYLIQRLQFGH